MEIILNKKESEDYFLNALCNGGLDCAAAYGLRLEFDQDAYNKVSKYTNCFEDILMEMLKNGESLTLVDEEGGEDSWTITLDDVHWRMSKVPMRHLMDMINENDDAITADAIIQYVFMEDIIFG